MSRDYAAHNREDIAWPEPIVEERNHRALDLMHPPRLLLWVADRQPPSAKHESTITITYTTDTWDFGNSSCGVGPNDIDVPQAAVVTFCHSKRWQVH
jgi:hypothetical protein